MNITKFLAIVLLFQTAVQAISFQEQYKEYVKNGDYRAAQKLERQTKKMKELGIDLNTDIVRNPDDASTVAELYIYYLTNEMPLFEQCTRRKIEKMKQFGISSKINIVKSIESASNLEERYVYYIINDMYLSSEILEKVLMRKNLKEEGERIALKQKKEEEERSLALKELPIPKKNSENKLEDLFLEIEKKTETVIKIEDEIRTHREILNAEIEKKNEELKKIDNFLKNREALKRPYNERNVPEEDFEEILTKKTKLNEEGEKRPLEQTQGEELEGNASSVVKKHSKKEEE